ncbi:MAG: hypothetical protein H7Y38_20180, partial [Armatimonadetes bacterium]|nr:hypothetical protein [Armatimonadota bacterium]
MKLLFVAGGHLPIPPTGWGAIERIIDEQRRFLETQGVSVGILNRRRPALWQLLRSRPWQYDVVHLYDDSRTKLWTRLYG